jgi:hypothetical protein
MADVTTELSAFQNLVASIPGGQGVYDALNVLHTLNPNMTKTQAMMLSQGMTATIGVGEAILPSLPVKVDP